VELSFEIAEKYFWSWLDFWRLGPLRFSTNVRQQPKSYLSPFQFFLASLLVAAIAWSVAYTVLAEVPQNLAATKHLPRFAGDVKTAILRRGFFVAFLLLIGSLPQRLVLLWPLKSPAGIKELLTAKFYSSGALLVVLASMDAVLIFPVLWIVEHVADRSAPIILLCYFFGELVIFGVVAVYYDLSTTCAFASLRRRRYIEGSCAVALLVTAAYSAVSSVVVVVLAITEREPELLLIPLIQLPIGVLTWWFLKRRVPKLRSLVQAEYVGLNVSPNP